MVMLYCCGNIVNGIRGGSNGGVCDVVGGRVAADDAVKSVLSQASLYICEVV